MTEQKPTEEENILSKSFFQAPPTAHYRIKGCYFIQEQCTYEEFIYCMNLPERYNLTKIELTPNILDVLQNIAKTDIARPLINKVLKLDNSNIFKWLINKYYIRKNKINIDDIISSLQLWEVGKILQDFFYLNVTMMTNSVTSQIISALTQMIALQKTNLTAIE